MPFLKIDIRHWGPPVKGPSYSRWEVEGAGALARGRNGYTDKRRRVSFPTVVMVCGMGLLGFVFCKGEGKCVQGEDGCGGKVGSTRFWILKKKGN